MYPGRPLLEVTVSGIKYHDGRGRGLSLLAVTKEDDATGKWLVTECVTHTIAASLWHSRCRKFTNNLIALRP